MAAFSPSDAAVEGFRLIGRRWRVVVGWSLFNLVALVALLILVAVLVAGIVPFATSRSAASAAGGVIAGLVVGLGELLVQVTIMCGLFRLELRPDAPGFLHLRIGGDELRVLGALILVVLAAIPLALLAGTAVGFGARVSPWVAAVLFLAAAVVFYGVLLRLGLATPIAFAEARISLAESWRRTRGQIWSLVGMALLLLCFVALLSVLVWMTMFLVSGFATGFADLGLSGAEAFEAHPGRYLLQLVVQLLLAPFWLVIGVAPWVAVYRATLPDGRGA